MGEYFAFDYTGKPFAFFGAAHIGALLAIALLNVFLLRYRNKPAAVRRNVCLAMTILLLLDESAWHVWNIYHGTWNIQEHLPLHACSLLIWLTGIMLLNKNYRIYEFAYFLGIGGAIQALLTPDIGIYGFPHFRFVQTFISHGLLLTAAVYMTTVEGFRPTLRSLLRVIISLNIYMAVIFVVNQLIGSNYLFVAHKPPGPTLLDVLPQWPWYILAIEAIGLVVFLTLYVPFAIKDWQTKRRATAV